MKLKLILSPPGQMKTTSAVAAQVLVLKTAADSARKRKMPCHLTGIVIFFNLEINHVL